MREFTFARTRFSFAAFLVVASPLIGCGGSGSGGGNGGNGGGGGTTIPPTPTAVVAAAANQQVGITWTGSSGATSYHVKRSTASGSRYTQIATPATTGFVDTAVSYGTQYFYVVSAVNTAGASANSAEVNATPVATPAQLPGPSASPFANPFYTCVNNYYVATTGSDSNAGTQASPWLTIQHADTAAGGTGCRRLRECSIRHLLCWRPTHSRRQPRTGAGACDVKGRRRISTVLLLAASSKPSSAK